MAADVTSAPVATAELRTTLRRALLPGVPLARVAVFRMLAYLFVVADMLWIVDDVVPHATTGQSLYKPLDLREHLHLPAPAHGYAVTERAVVALACVALVALTLRTLRGAPSRVEAALGVVLGLVVAAGFTDWVSIGMSYGKIDHDHAALVTTVWVLPTVGVAGLRDRTRSEAAGWALLCVQVGCVATYFLSAWAKVRFGGWHWVTGSTFTWAMTRRGTALGRAMMDPPWILLLGQWSVFLLELVVSPFLLILRGRWKWALAVVFAGFHLATYLTLGIHFLPLVVCLTAFLPLENLTPSAAPTVVLGD